MKTSTFNWPVFLTSAINGVVNKSTVQLFFALLLSAFSYGVIAAADTQLPAVQPNDSATGSTNTSTNAADESPMMLYLVPWNANPETGKSGKKFALYQPWGAHFDPLTPAQTVQLSTP